MLISSHTKTAFFSNCNRTLKKFNSNRRHWLGISGSLKIVGPLLLFWFYKALSWIEHLKIVNPVEDALNTEKYNSTNYQVVHIRLDSDNVLMIISFQVEAAKNTHKIKLINDRLNCEHSKNAQILHFPLHR